MNDTLKTDGDVISKIEHPSNFTGTLIFKIDELPRSAGNGHETLHAMSQAFFMEFTATMAVCAFDPELRPMHVGSGMTIDFINPVAMNQKLFIEASVIKTGRNMAHTEAVITDQATGKYICRSSYTKVF